MYGDVDRTLTSYERQAETSWDTNPPGRWTVDDAKRDALRERLLEESLPVATLDEALPHLRRPFSAEAVKWKVQSTWPKNPPKKGAVIVAYIDARLVIERLNAVVGGSWTAAYHAVAANEKLLRCDLDVFGVTRRDVGESPKKMSKDLISDALKRAAVQFGVGVSVYALPQVSWSLDSAGAALKAWGEGERATLLLTPHGHASLREGYREWLLTTGEQHFGPALDHGDIVPADEAPPEAAALEAEEDAETPSAPVERLDDDEARDLRERIEQAYTAIPKARRSGMPPAAFQASLASAAGSHEELRELLTQLQDMAGEAAAA
jgi:hypothetical protein